MAYFEKFSNISYDVVGNKNYKTIKDILTRVAVRRGLSETVAVFEKHDVKDGETPESLAFAKYNDTNLHWVILLFNEIADPYYEWPLGVRDFEKYVTDKYANPNGIHHYQIAQSSGNTTKMLKVKSDVVGATAVTNREYEETLNDARKQIKLLKPGYIIQFESELRSKMGQ